MCTLGSQIYSSVFIQSFFFFFFSLLKVKWRILNDVDNRPDSIFPLLKLKRKIMMVVVVVAAVIMLFVLWFCC